MSRNRSSKRCVCGTAFPDRVYSTLTIPEYMETVKIPKGHPYYDNHGLGWVLSGAAIQFAHHMCGTCGRQYALWCTAVLDDIRSGRWWVSDSSFFFSFDDEPHDDDGPNASAALKEAQDRASAAEAEIYRLKNEIRRLVDP